MIGAESIVFMTIWSGIASQASDIEGVMAERAHGERKQISLRCDAIFKSGALFWANGLPRYGGVGKYTLNNIHAFMWQRRTHAIDQRAAGLEHLDTSAQ